MNKAAVYSWRLTYRIDGKRRFDLVPGR